MFVYGFISGYMPAITGVQNTELWCLTGARVIGYFVSNHTQGLRTELIQCKNAVLEPSLQPKFQVFSGREYILFIY